MSWFAIAAIGMAIGFLGGLFGKGGSAIATPMLHLAGVPAMIAVAAPLPATIPAMLVATAAYRRERLVDARIVRWSVAVGIPATVVGALATRWVSGQSLLIATDLLIAVLGLRLLARHHDPGVTAAHDEPTRDPDTRTRLIAVAGMVGLASGLLANSGGFLLGPLYLAVLGLPVKKAFACSLAVAAALAVPGTLVHWALGHIDWAVVAAFGITSVPLSYLGARVAIKAKADHLERVYGGVLTVLGVSLLAVAR